jgi:L-asparaginase II
LLCSLADPETITFMRSAAKPFQAIPVVMSGTPERFGFTEREIALACGSHTESSYTLKQLPECSKRPVFLKKICIVVYTSLLIKQLRAG